MVESQDVNKDLQEIKEKLEPINANLNLSYSIQFYRISE